MDQLIYKYLNGDLNLQDRHKLNKWLEEDPGNKETLKRIEIYWKEYNSDLKDEEVDVRNRILSKMKDEERFSSTTNHSFFKYLTRIAAILVLSLSLGLILSRFTKEKDTSIPEITWTEKSSQRGQKITTILPDGTRVKLNTDSKILVPSQFSSDSRKVILEGEAFFDVVRDENRPFIIVTDNLEVRVLGTSFLVSAYKNQQNESVAVRSGKVEVTGINASNPIQLTKDEITRYDGEDRMEKAVISKPQLVFGWVDQQLLFDNHSIDEVLSRISRWYGVEISIRKEFSREKKYTASFENPTLIQVMDILAFVYDFDYELNENKDELIIK